MGQILVLNGTSSSGKTTLAHWLQKRLEEPYMVLSLDKFIAMYPERLTNPKDAEDFERTKRTIPLLVDGFHRSVRALAEAGNNLIVDTVFQEENWLKQCVLDWSGLGVLFVGVLCPLAVLEERERSRHDRIIGTAFYQYSLVHARAVYDLELDTSVLSKKQCIENIVQLMKNPPEKSAFEILREKFTAT